MPVTVPRNRAGAWAEATMAAAATRAIEASSAVERKATIEHRILSLLIIINFSTGRSAGCMILEGYF
jgi:hypothetical protein